MIDLSVDLSGIGGGREGIGWLAACYAFLEVDACRCGFFGRGGEGKGAVTHLKRGVAKKRCVGRSMIGVVRFD